MHKKPIKLVIVATLSIATRHSTRYPSDLTEKSTEYNYRLVFATSFLLSIVQYRYIHKCICAVCTCFGVVSASRSHFCFAQ